MELLLNTIVPDKYNCSTNILGNKCMVIHLYSHEKSAWEIESYIGSYFVIY